MNDDFQRCLENGKLVRFARGHRLVKKELTTANSDLATARESLGRESYKWATIQGYYAMFHGARALVYSKNYREKSHYCLTVALRNLFVADGALDVQFVRDFTNAMHLREAADYESDFSESGAKAVITCAERFLAKACSILDIDI